MESQKEFSIEGVTLSNLLHTFLESYSANTENIRSQLKNKGNNTKVHHFYLLHTFNSQHIILISSQKNCMETSVDHTTHQ